MIFFTLGTDHHPFSRLMNWLCMAVDSELLGTEEILVQHGYTQPFESHSVHFQRFLSYTKMGAAMDSARLIVTHPSTTAFEAIDRGKVPLVISRLKAYGEHVDDHQEEFVTECSDVLPFHVVRSYEEFVAALTVPMEQDARVQKLNALREAARHRFLDAFNRTILNE